MSDDAVSDDTTCRVDVLLFSVLRERVGAERLTMNLPAPATGEDLLDRLEAEYEAVRAYRSVLRLARNATYVPHGTPLADGDEVALITPVSGG